MWYDNVCAHSKLPINYAHSAIREGSLLSKIHRNITAKTRVRLVRGVQGYCHSMEVNYFVNICDCEMDLSHNCSLHGGMSEVCENRSMTSPKYVNNMGKLYIIVDVQVTDEDR